ncbi:MAG: cytochrome c3 family protein, partial [bacterium]|nr:cytochrome c3 family protein [bacterium]
MWVLTMIAVIVLASGTSQAKTPASMMRPKQVVGHGADGVAFVDNRVCQQCHPQPFQAWLGSHHQQSMQAANAKTVLGDFHNVSFTHQGVTSRFFTKDGKFLVHTEGVDGQMADFDIQYTFGVAPLQQYLIALPGGRLQSLSIAWDVTKQRWFHLYPNEKVKPGDALHWTGLYQTWNVMCAECHSTNLQKNYDPKTATYQTTWSAVNVSCQACHGPAGRHVEWAQGQKDQPLQPYRDNGLLVDFTKLTAQGQVETCARCHARRHRVSVNDRHGRPLLDDFVPEGLREGLYHADGQVLDEVYVYGSYLQSKMYHAGVRCTDCHQPHRLKLRATGNALCVQCHQAQPDTRF